jgi:CheY-like chemotaxis protein
LIKKAEWYCTCFIKKIPDMSKKALIVDDEEALREIISEVFSSLEIKCYPAGSGEEAIKTAKKQTNLDLIVLDMNMPGMSGEETYNHLKQKNPHTPLVFMSGYDLSAELEAMKLSCPNTFLKKPFTISDLTQVVAKVLP